MQVQQPTLALHSSEAVLACGLDGQLLADEQHGLFVRDTRVLSTYQIMIGSGVWMQLGWVVTSHDTATWEFQNSRFKDALGEVPEGTLLLSIHREMRSGMVDRLSLASFNGRTTHLRFVLQIDADFADIFEVKARSLPPRLSIARLPGPDGFQLQFQRGDFRRGLRVRFETETPYTVVGALTVFDLALKHGERWHCTVHFEPEVEPASRPPAPPGLVLADHPRPVLSATDLVREPFTRGQTDLRSLRATTPEGMPFLAAGVPWFFTLFGRDSLVTSLMAGIDGDWLARASLNVLQATQATAIDHWRDAEPGKIVHEKRYGELARTNSIPHSAYYGAHDAPALYCLTLWQAWRWTGDAALLRAYLPAAEAALHWCNTSGDRDGDGFLEYGTRSRDGYRNQSWKDAGEAIVHLDGTLAPLPIATVELQGYWFAAQLAMAELLEAVDRGDEADRLR
ncbi:MAG: hypothetical protein NTZ05_12950, partial [Chloroflexi bacterium]|nr:hypothetical protein [Chloroflexota bacterium]